MIITIPINRFTVALSVIFGVELAVAAFAMCFIDPEDGSCYGKTAFDNEDLFGSPFLFMDAEGQTEEVSGTYQHWGLYAIESDSMAIPPVYRFCHVISRSGWYLFEGARDLSIDSLETKTYYVLDGQGRITFQRDLSWNKKLKDPYVRIFNDKVLEMAFKTKDEYGNWSYKRCDEKADFYYLDGSPMSAMMLWFCRYHIHVDRFILFLGFLLSLYIIGWVLPPQWRLFHRGNTQD